MILNLRLCRICGSEFNTKKLLFSLLSHFRFLEEFELKTVKTGLPCYTKLVYLLHINLIFKGSLEKACLEMEMKPEMKIHFYGSSQFTIPVKESDCLEECYFNETCQFFTFKDSICYLGMYNYTNGTILDNSEVNQLFIIQCKFTLTI